MSGPKRSDFADPAAYARAMRQHGPSSDADIDAYVGLAGEDGAILDATWGTRAERNAEQCAEQRAEVAARPHVLVEKLRRARWPAPPSPGATVLSVEDVGEVLSAAEFARSRGWLFGMSLTLLFSLMGVVSAAEVKESLKRLLKCLAQWCRDNGLPRAYIAVVENGPTVGLHLHVALHLPVRARAVFRAWIEGWVRAECARRGVAYARKAWQLNRSRKEYPLTHWMLAHYLVKGCDSGAIVQAAYDAPDGRPVLLRDVLAYEYHDPGVVPLERVHFGVSINARARGAWRSKWARGERDVNVLYAPEFVKFVRRWCPVATLSEAEIAPMRAASLALGEWYTRAKTLGDALSGEKLAWQTVVERNVEIIQRELLHVNRQFASAAAVRDPHDRRAARTELRAAVVAAQRATNENGEEVAAFVDKHKLPLGRLAVHRLAAVEAAVRALGALLGVDAVRPPWALQTDLDSLAI